MSFLFFIGLWIWTMSGLLNFGYLFNYYQKEYPTIAKEHIKEDYYFAALGCFMGGIGLIATILTGQYKHGLYYPREDKQ